ncbi:hypothetical protein [Albibacterium profundi]|uniref:Uncharacterized protein n=1 Tax=Albibacterium profundi TaxID=3134906 RepID=A0ABV5CEU9_9SPHI
MHIKGIEMDKGWISIHRKVVDSPYYFSEPFTKMQAWFDMLIIANHKAGFFFKRGIKVDVKRGQIGYDLESLAKRWMWSRGKVERFLNALENDNQIVRQKTNVTTLISITNYDEYQNNDKANSNPNDNANGHQTVKQTVKQTDTNNNVNKYNKNNKENNIKETRKQKLAQTGFEISLNNFLEMRKKIRKPATDRAVEMIKNELEKLSGGNEELKIQILDQSTMNSWQGVFPLKEDFSKKEKDSGQKEKESKFSNNVEVAKKSFGLS